MTLDRRHLLKSGVAGLPLFGLGASLRAMTAAADTAPNASRRLLTVFLRGGNDGLNAVIPHGDPDYVLRRPTIHYGAPGSGAMRIATAVPGYSQVGMHPSLAPLLPLMNHPAGNRVAFLHRVGNFGCQRSHFTEMHLVETGRVDYSATDQGWLPQLLPQLGSAAIMPSVSESNRLMRMYLSGDPGKAPTHLQKAYASGATRTLAIPFAEPMTPGLRVASFARNAVVASTGTYPVVGEGGYLRATTVGAIDVLATLRASLPSFPHAGSRYPSLPGDPGYDPKYALFFDRLEEAVQYLKGGFANFVGLELGGWDTHQGQLADQAVLLDVLARALAGAHDDLDGGSDDFLILVVSEFGRTVADNGSGTDHGVGGLCVAVGSRVRGGIYNCSHSTWPQVPGTPTGVAPWDMLATTPSSGPFANALVPRTDFRVPLVEIATRFFGFSNGQVGNLDEIGPHWQAILTNQQLTENRLLDYLF